VTPEQNYLRDMLSLMVERAKEARQFSITGNDNRTKEEQAFENGRALAYYEVVSTLLNQADAFGLSRDVFPVLNFDPDRELL
jgi:hypothetical protein